MIQTPAIPMEELDFKSPERETILLGYKYVDRTLFDNPLEFVIESLKGRLEEMKQLYPTATLIRLKEEDEDYEIEARGLESDQAYQERVDRAYKRAVKQRQDELATLKRLRAKYPNVTFE